MSKMIAAVSVTLLVLGGNAAYAQTMPSVTRQSARPAYVPPTPPARPAPQQNLPPSTDQGGSGPAYSPPGQHAPPSGYRGPYGIPQYPGPHEPLPTQGTYYANPYDPYNPYNPYNPYGYYNSGGANGSPYLGTNPYGTSSGYPSFQGYDTRRRR